MTIDELSSTTTTASQRGKKEVNTQSLSQGTRKRKEGAVACLAFVFMAHNKASRENFGLNSIEFICLSGQFSRLENQVETNFPLNENNPHLTCRRRRRRHVRFTTVCTS